MQITRILFTMTFSVLFSGAKKNDLEIQTLYGKLRGRTVPAFGEESVDAFLGIPYGAPTWGRNRFAPPSEPDTWTGVLDAGNFSRPCFQVIPREIKKKVWWASGREESEDCLKLNVWVPRPRPSKAAVMIWFHGGGFCAGSTDVPRYNGARLSAHEHVIVVTVNYRLSAFGFLYFDHPLAPGNAGLRDQALAIRWVNRNIEAFGGDPKRITIVGQSAGALSVAAHLMSPTTGAFFKDAIIQSGAMNVFWGVSDPEEALERAHQLAEHSGCSSSNENKDEIVCCLQNLSGEKLYEAAMAVEGGLLRHKFKPVIDGIYLKSEEIVSPDKNVLLGYTREDGSYLIPIHAPNLTRSDKFSYTQEELKGIMSLLIKDNEVTTGLPLELVRFIYTEWPSNHTGGYLTFDGTLQSVTDRWFGCPVSNFADVLAKNGNNVYFYRFDQQPLAPAASISEDLPWMGAAHTDEIPFQFGQKLEAAPQEVNLSKQIMRYWADFAKNGDPNNNGLPTWPKYTSERKQCMYLDSTALTVGEAQRQKECAFWGNIYPWINKASKGNFFK